MINVTKTFLPPKEEYIKYLDRIWESGHVTNHGPMVNELEQKLKDYFGVKHFFFLSNGTAALQIAIKALDLKGEIITTPFSYVASTSSISWQQAVPVFVDINPDNFTINVEQIEPAITKKTTGILATHIYGIPCNVEAIDRIATKHNLKVIYDGAHAFATQYNGKSVFHYGNVSALSFHATKLFHTVEGGGLITDDDALAHRISYMRNFGHKGQEDFWGLGINGKNSEFHAAMGLSNFAHLEQILQRRKYLSTLYNKTFESMDMHLQKPVMPEAVSYNFAYYPVVFGSEKELLSIRDNLNAFYIYPRRYFYPALHTLPYIKTTYKLPVAESISKRVMCLPLYHDLSDESVVRICSIIAQVLKN